MSTLVDGADIAILADTGRVPFVLDIHLLDDPASLLNPVGVVNQDVTCDVLTASWTWGAGLWQGPLTIPEAGSLHVVFADPERKLDPGNPYGSPPAPGSLVQVTVDGAPAWSGYVSDVSHSLANRETVLLAHDAIAMLTGMTFPGGLAAGTTVDNYHAVLDQVGWPAAGRIVYGAPAAYRSAGGEPVQAWPALLRIARAELGAILPDRAGRIAFRSRGIDEGAVTVPVIGCDGADLEDVLSLVERRAIIDHVLIEPDDTHPVVEWSDPPAIAAYGRRSLRATRDELRLSLAP